MTIKYMMMAIIAIARIAVIVTLLFFCSPFFIMLLGSLWKVIDVKLMPTQKTFD
jgi:hypothetical protein